LGQPLPDHHVLALIGDLNFGRDMAASTDSFASLGGWRRRLCPGIAR
jgi:hypothetical protein